MGNSESSGSNSGLNEYCYNTGYDHGKISTNLHPDAISDSLAAAPCTYNKNANESYARGYTDGMNDSSTSSSSMNHRHP